MAAYFYIPNNTTPYQPTTPNVAYTRLGCMVASLDTTAPQYQFVMDVYESGSAEYIVRMVQTPDNITQNAQYPDRIIFDPSRIFQGELDFDNNWKVTGSIQPVNSVKTFELKVGEQYGTSPSSSITVYPNQDSMSIEVFPGVVNPVENDRSTPFINLWDFNTSSYDGGGNVFLTNCPSAQAANPVPDGDEAYLMNSTDYFTVTSLKENYFTSGVIEIAGVYVENGIQSIITSSYITAADGLGEFTTWGFGPQNLADWSTGWADLISSGSINALYTYNDPGGICIYINNLWDGIGSTIGNLNLAGAPFKQCSDEYTRFAFINKYGFWDYYNIYNPVRTTTALERKNYNKPQLVSGIAGYTSNRYSGWGTGYEQFYLRSTDTYSIDTDYITEETANWLEELLESPEVYLQEGSDFVPIVLTNSSYEHNNSTSRNKLFQYTIEWVYANPRRSRL